MRKLAVVALILFYSFLVWDVFFHLKPRYTEVLRDCGILYLPNGNKFFSTGYNEVEVQVVDGQFFKATPRLKEAIRNPEPIRRAHEKKNAVMILTSASVLFQQAMKKSLLMGKVGDMWAMALEPYSGGIEKEK